MNTISTFFINIQANRKARWYMLFIVSMLLCASIFPFAWRWSVQSYYSESIYTPEDALQQMPIERVAIVFGARVYRNGNLSGMLRDRVDTAILLYEAGKIDKLIFSGDNRFVDYNEPGEMAAYAIAKGIPAQDIQPDYGGRRTYDTCYRAHHIFQIDSAILITQEFHLPRALFLCSNLGIRVQGVRADLQVYNRSSLSWSERRELPALLVALFDIIRQIPPPVLGDPIPIE